MSRALDDDRLRDPCEVVGLAEGLGPVAPGRLEHRADDGFWAVLADHRLRLLVTREYEHLVVALAAVPSGPEVSYLALPHPSGVAVAAGAIHIACTRNPNMVVTLRATSGSHARGDAARGARQALVPMSARFYPGSLYLHDIAVIGGVLHGNAAGWNAIVTLEGAAEPVWWPASIERRARPDFRRNYLQLNSIAAGMTLGESYFTASCDRRGETFPGDPAFPVDGRGVVFAAASREPCVRGLTRPHSARLRQGKLWLDNSGYGEVGVVESGRFEVVARLGGWTRGLAFHAGVAFVATSRVLPRFRSYAPGLDPEQSRCAIHAIDAASGRSLGTLEWPGGDQIFAVEALAADTTPPLPYTPGAGAFERARRTFYGYRERGP